jgi:hypothetical protein
MQRFDRFRRQQRTPPWEGDYLVKLVLQINLTTLRRALVLLLGHALMSSFQLIQRDLAFMARSYLAHQTLARHTISSYPFLIQ